MVPDSKQLFRTVIWIYLLLGLAVGAAWAESVDAVGTGRTKDEAIQKAVHAAVEQALGAYIKSDTRVQQGELVYDSIISSSAGYVRSYHVLAEGQDPIEDTYKVKIRAEVDGHKLKSALEEFLKDPRFQKTFQKTSFDQRRVVVMYQKGGEGALSSDSFGVKTLLDLVQDKLSGYGFRVFLEDQLTRIRSKASDLMVDEETSIELARQEAADAVVLASINGGTMQTSDGYTIIRVTVTLKVFDVTSGELFANVQERDKTLSRGGSFGLSDDVSRAAIKAGSPAVDRLVQKVVELFSLKRDKFVVLMIRDVPLDTQDQIEDMLATLGWKYRISSQTGTYMELEIFDVGSPTDVRRGFRKALQEKNLQLTPVEIKGSRLIFSGRS